jgi:hypothetical protein
MATTKTISVKVSTAKVVKALETALADKKKQIADNEKAKKEYEKEVTDFRNNLADLFRSGKGKVTSVSKAHNFRYQEDTNRYELVIEFPASIKAPTEPENLNDWGMKSDIEELENAIAVLKMTDEETVNTNTYKGVARFIK